MNSIWQNDFDLSVRDSLRGDISTDVAIVGGGICGILCAYMLSRSGVDCVVLDMEKVCSSVTANTTAKITLQHGLIYNKIIKRYGLEYARLYYESQKNALCKFGELAQSIDCDYGECNSYVYSVNDPKIIQDEADALNKIGCNAEVTKETQLPFEVSGAVKVKNQAKFHPLKFVSHIAKDLKIFENTKVLEIRDNVAITKNGKIYAKSFIVASHFPFINKHGAYFLKMFQHRSYVLALKNAHEIKDMYVDEASGGLSFRSYKDTLILGGGGHRTGQKGGSWKELEEFAQKYYPSSQIIQKWSTQDCMTLDNIPYIGRYSKSTPNLYVATGFNKWGMSSSMTSALILSDMICGRKNDYADVYFPSRTILHPQLAINAFESVKNLLTPTVPRCPHMGCALKYNREEHSWDCACHGSRFDENGKILNNPSQHDCKS